MYCERIRDLCVTIWAISWQRFQHLLNITLIADCLSFNPVYKQAIAWHRATKRNVADMIAPTSDSDHWDAVAWLEADWFFKYMERY